MYTSNVKAKEVHEHIWLASFIIGGDESPVKTLDSLVSAEYEFQHRDDKSAVREEIQHRGHKRRR